MSFITERKNRDQEAEDLFGNIQMGATAPLTSATGISQKYEGLREKFIKLEKLRKTEMSGWWDAATLKQYIKVKRIPRGLRSQIIPTYDDLETDLLIAWERELTGNSD